MERPPIEDMRIVYSGLEGNARVIALCDYALELEAKLKPKCTCERCTGIAVESLYEEPPQLDEWEDWVSRMPSGPSNFENSVLWEDQMREWFCEMVELMRRGK